MPRRLMPRRRLRLRHLGLAMSGVLAVVREAVAGVAVTACQACQFDPDATVLASWTIRTEINLGTLNARVFNGKQGWRYRANRDIWHSGLLYFSRLQRIPKATGKRRVTLTRIYAGRGREMDLGNIDVKACVDAMKLAGLIVDDKPALYEGHVKQERGAESGTRIHIEELSQ